MCMNASIMVNSNIIGGFKYANPMTGSLFINQDDVVDKVRLQLQRFERGEMNPREWYMNFATMALKRLESFVLMLWEEHQYYLTPGNKIKEYEVENAFIENA